MKTLTLTQARATLGELCERARGGEDIGIISGDQVLQLVPVEVKAVVPGDVTLIPMTEGYLLKEYGVTPAEFAAFRKRRTADYVREKRKGMIRRFSGDLEKDLRD